MFLGANIIIKNRFLPEPGCRITDNHGIEPRLRAAAGELVVSKGLDLEVVVGDEAETDTRRGSEAGFAVMNCTSHHGLRLKLQNLRKAMVPISSGHQSV
mgnify:CR=1 FL=1